MRPLRPHSVSTQGCWSTTPTCSSCSSKFWGLQLPHSPALLSWWWEHTAWTKPRAVPLRSLCRCRQFVEMVNGTDSEVRSLSSRSPKSQDSYPGSPNLSPRHGPSSSHMHSTGQPLCRRLWEVLVWRRKATYILFPGLDLGFPAGFGGREMGPLLSFPGPCLIASCPSSSDWPLAYRCRQSQLQQWRRIHQEQAEPQ